MERGISKIYSSYSFRGNYSRAETIQGRKLLIVKRFLPRKLIKGGNYSRAETIRGNAVVKCDINKQNILILDPLPAKDAKSFL